MPAENLVGEENKGVNVMTSGLDIERIVLAGGSVGMAQQALDYSIKYSVEREQFGQSIATFQMIQQKLADMYARTEASRLLVYRAAEAAQKSRRGEAKAQNSQSTPQRLSFSLPKRPPGFATRPSRFMAAMGTALNFPVQKLWRDAKLYEIGAGTSEIRRLIIARELTRDEFAKKSERFGDQAPMPKVAVRGA